MEAGWRDSLSRAPQGEQHAGDQRLPPHHIPAHATESRANLPAAASNEAGPAK